MLDRPPLSRTPDPALHFIDDQHDAVPIADSPQFLHEDRWRNHIAALTLDRLDKNCRYFLRCERCFEELLLDESCTPQRESLGFLRTANTPAIYIWITDVRHSRNQRRESPPLLRLRRRQRQRAHGASVKRTEERDDVLPLRVIPRQFQRTLDRFRARVAV